jgi:adenylate cyclase
VPILRRGVDLCAAHREELSTPITAQDPAILSLCQLGIVTWLLGEPDMALRHIEDAKSLAEKLGHPINVALLCAYAAEVHQLRGEPHKAAEYASKGVSTAMEHGYDYWVLLNLAHRGIAKTFLGNAADGVADSTRAIAALRGAGARANLPYFLGASAEGALLGGDIPSATRLIHEAFEAAEHTHELFFMALLYCTRGSIAANNGDEAAAERDFLAASRFAQEQGARSAELRAALCLYRLRLRQGRGGESQPMLTDAYAAMTEGFDTADGVAARELLKRAV